MSTDPIADMLTRIRNAHMALHKDVKVPASKMKLAILNIMAEQGFIHDYQLQDRDIRIFLKYVGSQPAIQDLQKVSKPSRRVFAPVKEIPFVRNGLGICIISTSRGIMDDRQARERNIGGELICEIW